MPAAPGSAESRTQPLKTTTLIFPSPKLSVTFEPGMIDFPTVHDGAEGVRFVQACLQSNEKGNAWVTMDENA